MRNGTHLSNRYREKEEKRERGERENEDLFVRHSFEGIAKIALRV